MSDKKLTFKLKNIITAMVILLIITIGFVVGKYLFTQFQSEKNIMQLQAECFDTQEILDKITFSMEEKWDVSEDLRIDNLEIVLTDKNAVPKQSSCVSFIDIYDYKKECFYEVSWRYDQNRNCTRIDCKKTNRKQNKKTRFTLEDIKECLEWEKSSFLNCSSDEILIIALQSEILEKEGLNREVAETIYLADITEKNAITYKKNAFVLLSQEQLKKKYSLVFEIRKYAIEDDHRVGYENKYYLFKK